MRLLFLFLIATGVASSQAAPADSTGPDTVIRVNAQQVLVPVIVTDKKGHHVSGLRASDFRVLEDGVPQQINAFSTDTAASVDDVGALSRAPAETPASTPAAAPAGVRHTYVICVDTMHSSPANAVRLQEALENLFREEKRTDAQYVLIGIGRQMQVLQTATTNPLAVLLKIRGAGFQAALGGLDGSALAAQVNNLKTHMDDFCRRCPCGARANSRGCDSDIDNLKQSVDGDATRWTALSKVVAAQFKSVVEELAKIPTGRTLILVSDGFNLDPTREFYSVVAAYLPSSPQFHLPEAKELEPSLQAALKTASERNIAIYGIDSRGGLAPSLASSGVMDAGGSGGGREVQSVLGRSSNAPIRSTSLQSAPDLNSKPFATPGSETMEQLSLATGGVYSHDAKDLLKEFHNALADGREYYVLAYVPKSAGADGRFRRITVEIPGKGLNVRAKAGYWPAAAAQ